MHLDCHPTVAWNLLHYIYSDEPAYGSLTMTELYHLFLAAQAYELPQLASRCYRQLKACRAGIGGNAAHKRTVYFGGFKEPFATSATLLLMC